jgi:hypothetical protein
MAAYIVFYLDDANKQVFAGRYGNFVTAQSRRDQLRVQGYEAWIEDAEPLP